MARQTDIAETQNKITTASQRAFVYVALESRKYPSEDDFRLVDVYASLKNSGQTWARNLRIRKAAVPRDEPWEQIDWNSANSTPMILGPG
jgi:hypothetical protein